MQVSLEIERPICRTAQGRSAFSLKHATGRIKPCFKGLRKNSTTTRNNVSASPIADLRGVSSEHENTHRVHKNADRV